MSVSHVNSHWAGVEIKQFFPSLADQFNNAMEILFILDIADSVADCAAGEPRLILLQFAAMQELSAIDDWILSAVDP